MTIKIIACVDMHGNLGNNNELLFKLKEDMKHFRNLTLGNYVVMGRSTYESLPSVLKDRVNVVLTRNKNYQPKDNSVVVEHDIHKIINHYNETGNQEKDLFVIGGQQIYEQFLPYADEVYLTEVIDIAPKADTVFPMDLLEEYFEIDECAITDCSNEDVCVFNTYKRKDVIQ